MNAPRSLLLTASLLLGGCHRTPPTDPPAEPTAPHDEATRPAPPDSEPPARYVLLRESATLATGLDGTADTAHALDPDQASSVLSLVWIMRVVDQHGSWLEVQTVQSDEGDTHCASPLRGFDGYRLRLFVRTEDVTTVIRHEVEVQFPNGNRVTLGPGMPLTPPARQGGPVRVHTRPELSLSIPTDAIGHDYTEPRHYDTAPPIGTLELRSLQLSDEVRLPGYLRSYVFDHRDDGDAAIVTLASGCMRYELRVPPSTFKPLGGLVGAGELGGHDEDGDARYRVAAEAPVYWTNGERAGATRHERLRFDEPARREVGRVCFAHRITLGSRPQSTEPELTLCFDDVDVQPIERGPAVPAAAPR